MTIHNYFKGGNTRKPASIGSPQQPHHVAKPVRVVVAPSNDEVMRRLSRRRVIMHDGHVPVEAKFVRWQKTHAGAMGAVFRNPLTRRVELWGLCFHTHKPRMIAVL